jgi:hypothetical protein
VKTGTFDKREHLTGCKRLLAEIDAYTLRAEVAGIPADAWDNQRAPVHRHTRSVFLKGYPPALQMPDDPEQPVLENCPYIRTLIYGLLPGTVGKCLLASLQPGHLVYPHTDSANAYFIGSFRVHIPVVTSPQALVFCNGEFFHMACGEAWLLNNLAPHAVINDHATLSRIHLIFDVFPAAESVAMVDRLPETRGRSEPDILSRLVAVSRADAGQKL